MLQANAELDEIRQRIRAEIEKIALGLSNELELARTREQGLEENLRTTEVETGTQSRQAIQLRALEREAAANRALFETFLSRFKETSSTQGLQTSDSRIISAAEVPGGPSAPNRQRLLTLFTLGGFIIACALVFSLHALHPGLLTPEQVEQELGKHVLGILPKVPANVTPYAHARSKQGSAFIEALNSLKISLQLSDPDGQLKVMQVTSSVPEEGKSSLALTLSMIQAQAGKKVLLVDADLRRGGIERQVGRKFKQPGLTDLVLDPDANLDDYVTRIDDDGPYFMRSGKALQANATDIFSSKRMAQIIQQLRERFDFVILDAPPVLAVADARVIGTLADKTLFVIRWDKTPRKVARAALDLLAKGEIPIVGICLQVVDLGRYGRLGHGDSGYYYHYGRYGQYYRE
jgi:capsular exopolysaccharide synthesis family protein